MSEMRSCWLLCPAGSPLLQVMAAVSDDKASTRAPSSAMQDESPRIQAVQSQASGGSSRHAHDSSWSQRAQSHTQAAGSSGTVPLPAAFEQWVNSEDSVLSTLPADDSAGDVGMNASHSAG